MRFFDDPGKALQQMEDELLEEDWDEEDVDAGMTRIFKSSPAAAAARSTTPWTLTARSTTTRKRTTPITRKIILPTAKAGKSSGRNQAAGLQFVF